MNEVERRTTRDGFVGYATTTTATDAVQPLLGGRTQPEDPSPHEPSGLGVVSLQS
jgi:hypothetical protein